MAININWPIQASYAMRGGSWKLGLGIEGEYGQRTSIVISTRDKRAHHDQKHKWGIKITDGRMVGLDSLLLITRVQVHS